MKAITVGALLVVLLVGCSGTKGLKVTEQNKATVLGKVAQSKDLSQEEKESVATYFLRSSLGGYFGIEKCDPVGKTIGQIIAEQRAYVTQEKAREEKEQLLAKEAAVREESLATELRKALTFAIFEKKDISGDFFDHTNFKAVYQNNTDKEIKGFRGVVVFQDMFGDEISRLYVKITDPIRAGLKATWKDEIYSDAYKFKKVELKDMKVLWKPTTIIFADGTVLGEPPPKEQIE